MSKSVLKIGSRSSPLALAQAQEVRRALVSACEIDEKRIAIIPMTTTGDRLFNSSLAEIGGKGLFTKEIEEALLDGYIDMAVHSMKDMPTTLPQGLEIVATLEREDPREAFVSFRFPTLLSLPQGASLGSSSLRRKSQVKHLRPDIEIVPFRGNVQTRLKKLETGSIAATFLAYAGLKRLGLADVATSIMPLDDMLPAVAQGIIGIEIKSKNKKVTTLLSAINHLPTYTAMLAERAFLEALDGSCRTPLAGYATLVGETLSLQAMALLPNGTAVFRSFLSGSCEKAQEIGKNAAAEIKEKAGALWADISCLSS